jgi:hypothetical protein
MIITPPSTLIQANGFLETLNNPVAAYSLDRLTSRYTGAVIKLRRSGDNLTMDIGFDALGLFDKVTALAFVGAGNGFVDTWYDQMAGAKHLIQTVLANQPQLITAGVIAVGNSNTKPGIIFTGTMGLEAAAPMANTDEMTLLLTYKQTATGLGTGCFDFSGDTTVRAFAHMPWSDSNIYWDLGNVNGPGANWRINALDSAALNTAKVVGFTHSRVGNSKSIQVNGTQLVAGVATNPSIAVTKFGLGYIPAYGIGLAGIMSEVILFSRVPPAPELTRITAAIKSKYSII